MAKRIPITKQRPKVQRRRKQHGVKALPGNKASKRNPETRRQSTQALTHAHSDNARGSATTLTAPAGFNQTSLPLDRDAGVDNGYKSKKSKKAGGDRQLLGPEHDPFSPGSGTLCAASGTQQELWRRFTYGSSTTTVKIGTRTTAPVARGGSAPPLPLSPPAPPPSPCSRSWIWFSNECSL